MFTIYVQFIWLANVVFLKKANNRTCPSYNIRKYGGHIENVNTNFWLSSANVFLRNNKNSNGLLKNFAGHKNRKTSVLT